MNTLIATTKNGNIYVDFNGSNYAKPCYIKIIGNEITATYNRKNAGLLTEGMAVGKEVRCAVNQKWTIDSKECKIAKKDFSSPMEALKNITGVSYNGSLIENAKIIN
jgi:hypothetical protein